MKREAIRALLLVLALAAPASAGSASGVDDRTTGSDELGARHESSFTVDHGNAVSRFLARHGVSVSVLSKRFHVWRTRAQVQSTLGGAEPPGGLIALEIGGFDLEVNASRGFNINRYAVKAPMQLSVGPVPVYVELAIGASVGVTPSLSRPTYRDTRFELKLATGVQGKAEAGIGTKWARVSIEGTYKPLGLEIKNRITTNPDTTTAEVLARVFWSYGLGIKAKVGWFSYKHNFVSGGDAYGDADWVLFRGVAKRGL